jgi:hypothetical protein
MYYKQGMMKNRNMHAKTETQMEEDNYDEHLENTVKRLHIECFYNMIYKRT